MNGIVIAVCRSKTHTFSKSNQIEIRQLGDCAVVEVTGLRNPWVQLDRFQAGLMQATLEGGENGGLVGRAGIMGIVIADGDVRSGDPIRVELPPTPHHPLERV